MALTLIEMTLTGGVLILLVLLLRAIFLNRLPKTAFIIMWSVVLLRLLVPISFVGLFSSTEVDATVVETVFTEETTPSPNITDVKETYTFEDVASIAESSKQASIFRTI